MLKKLFENLRIKYLILYKINSFWKFIKKVLYYNREMVENKKDRRQKVYGKIKKKTKNLIKNSKKI